MVYADQASYPFTADPATLWARWVEVVKVQTVKFDPNGGSGAMADQSASTATALSKNTFTRSGYLFEGWAKTAGTQTEYWDTNRYPFEQSATLYATWHRVTVVAFYANGGSGSMADQGASVPTALTLNAGAITRSGFAFNGWNTFQTGNGKAYADGATYPFTASATLFATWGCLPLSVTASAKRVGTYRAEVTFSSPQNESPWTSLAAFAAKDGGKGATTVPTLLTSGTIPINGLDKNSGYTFDVTATNAAGCVYTATANRVVKW